MIAMKRASDRAAAVKNVIILACLVAVCVISGILGAAAHTSFGKVLVENVFFENAAGTSVRAKLLWRREVTSRAPGPGIVYVHGYQNNRETSDPFAIELSRRGFVVLSIDAIGRGNSGFPERQDSPLFDKSFGTEAALEYLKRLEIVDASRIGLMGNSLGAEIVYDIALSNPDVKALAFTGFGFDKRATQTNPKNMLMIFGAWDEHRERMIGGYDLKAWLNSEVVKQAVGSKGISPGETVGSFEAGTARRIEFPKNVHLGVSHTNGPVSQSVEWMRAALHPADDLWIPADEQIWAVKEWSSLLAMIAGLLVVLPLAALLLKTRFFKSTVQLPLVRIVQPRAEIRKHLFANTVLMWLYFPLILVAFGVHFYLVPIDGVFPMMLANGILFWFFIINLIGFGLFVRWRRRSGYTWASLGLSMRDEAFYLSWRYIGRTAFLGMLLFGVSYLLAYVVESIWMVDYRFLFPFASDLTPARAGIALRYLPFVFVGCVQTSIFLNIQLQGSGDRPRRFVVDNLRGTLAMVVPLVVMLAVQYVPFMLFGVLPFVGPGGGLISFAMNLFHIIGVLLIACPIFIGLYHQTGRPYLGAVVVSLMMTWMFASSHVVAPIPV